MIEREEIDLVDEQNTPFLQKQLTDYVNAQQQNANGGPGDDILDDEQVDIRLESPKMSQLDNAELKI